MKRCKKSTPEEYIIKKYIKINYDFIVLFFSRTNPGEKITNIRFEYTPEEYIMQDLAHGISLSYP